MDHGFTPSGGDDGFLRHLDATVRAAEAQDPAFGELMPELMQRSRNVPVAALDAAMPRMAEGVEGAALGAAAFLAVITGSWIERGATARGVDRPVLRRLLEAADLSTTFLLTWSQAVDAPPPDPAQDSPSQEVFDVVAPALDDPASAMLAWFALEKLALAANTVLSSSRPLRASITGREDKARLVGGLERYCPVTGWVASLLRVLEDERVLVLDRATRRGWTVSLTGIGDNFQLHVLLADALAGRPGGMPGTPPPRDIAAYFRDTEAPEPPPTAHSEWNLVDAHGEWIYNEGVPADIPDVNGTRVVVLDPPSYPRAFPAGRKYPMMPGDVVLEGMHLPEDLAAWWPHVKPATR
ncbi:hypothetical protein [Actinomadura atramentaria]|uniref:hypothetical protein n=1 Tax=Actinomadura atramentaria TaxID=1990 RepID=UPI00036CCAC8|nr:hypothetical protein [Actinomadura atramentaria]